ncbi:hypothetical protein C8J57DRAFT_1712679 [Mycena rebaudengoi]|nr:hypothetical protein C8J57DRAFT_1712679 [Mycena rebaudengoi]
MPAELDDVLQACVCFLHTQRLMSLDAHSTMEELSARVEEITAKMVALTARMDALEPPSLPGTDSQRSPPSQTKADAPTPPGPFSFASADKGFGFWNPSPTSEGGTSAAPKPFSFFSTSAQDFGLPKQSQPTTSIFTTPNPAPPKPFSLFSTSAQEFAPPKQSQPTTSTPNPVSFSTSGKNGSATLFGHPPLRTGSAQSQTNIFSQPPMFPSTSAGTDFAFQNQSQTRGDGAVPSRPSFFLPMTDSQNTAQTPSPSGFAPGFPIGTESKTRDTQHPAPPKTYVSSSPTPSQSQGTDSRKSVHRKIIVKLPSLPRPPSLGSSGKESGSLESSQRMNDMDAQMAADFTQLGVSSLPKDPGIPPQSAATQEILTTSFRAEPDRPHTEFHISHSLSNCNNEAWIRHRLIDSKEPILFVGESKNRSLPVALAIMRESWDGIWASSLDKRETQTLPALLASAQERSRINSRILGRLKKSSPWKSVPEMRQNLSELTDALDLKSQDEVTARLSLVVDATKLKTSVQGPTRNIWFQCPWISRNDNKTTTAKLLEAFIFSAAAIQKSGDTVFLGLTARTEYRGDYDLENLKKVAHRLGYEIFMDEWFILHAIDAGYEHESVVKDIHELLINFHQTFVLVRRDRSEHASVKEQINTQGKELEAQLKVLERHLLDLRAREEELSLVDEAMN